MTMYTISNATDANEQAMILYTNYIDILIRVC